MYSKPLEDEKNRLNPLTVIDLQIIEDSRVSNFDKHYIRLMAHCLGCFKAMADGSTMGPFPNQDIRLKWLQTQIQDLLDESFLYELLEQFVSAANQLEQIADYFKISPLELTVDYLIKFVRDVEKSSNTKKFP